MTAPQATLFCNAGLLNSQGSSAMTARTAECESDVSGSPRSGVRMKRFAARACGRARISGTSQSQGCSRCWSFRAFSRALSSSVSCLRCALSSARSWARSAFCCMASAVSFARRWISFSVYRPPVSDPGASKLSSPSPRSFHLVPRSRGKCVTRRFSKSAYSVSSPWKSSWSSFALSSNPGPWMLVALVLAMRT
jgi:hypothetical protein